PLVHESVVYPVVLAGPRVPSGRGDGQPDLGIAGADRCGDGALAVGGGPGQNGDRGRRLLGAGPGGGIAHSAKCATSFSAWWEPRPRILREGEMPISSMICCALTLPTPGSASSRAETRSRPTTSLVSASVRTFLISSPRWPALSLSRALMAARSRRASAALFRASARCSGVMGGTAAVLTSCAAAGDVQVPEGHDVGRA